MEMPKIGISLEENHLREYVALSIPCTLVLSYHFNLVRLLCHASVFPVRRRYTSAGVRQFRQRPEWNDSPHTQLSSMTVVSPLDHHLPHRVGPCAKQ
jgi:hypothetical protein